MEVQLFTCITLVTNYMYILYVLEKPTHYSYVAVKALRYFRYDLNKVRLFSSSSSEEQDDYESWSPHDVTSSDEFVQVSAT